MYHPSHLFLLPNLIQFQYPGVRPDAHQSLVVCEQPRPLVAIPIASPRLLLLQVRLIELDLDGRQSHCDHILVFCRQELGQMTVISTLIMKKTIIQIHFASKSIQNWRMKILCSHITFDKLIIQFTYMYYISRQPKLSNNCLFFNNVLNGHLVYFSERFKWSFNKIFTAYACLFSRP